MNMEELLDQCHNMFGPVGPDIRKRITRVIVDPTQETWEDAHSILITHNCTLWQAWLEVEPDAPRSKPLDGPWPKVPSTFVLYRAILNATGGEN